MIANEGFAYLSRKQLPVELFIISTVIPRVHTIPAKQADTDAIGNNHTPRAYHTHIRVSIVEIRFINSRRY